VGNEEMTDESKDTQKQGDAEQKRVDEEWKRQAREEREKLAEESSKPKAPLPPPNFTLFLSGMATQALIALGEIENPATGKREVNLDQAKYTIDLLQIIEEKTKGNLTDEEQKYLDRILYDLRIAYVRVAGG